MAALQIKPLLHVNEKGCLQVKEKPRGCKKAISAQLARMKQGWMPELGKLALIYWGNTRQTQYQKEGGLCWACRCKKHHQLLPNRCRNRDIGL